MILNFNIPTQISQRSIVALCAIFAALVCCTFGYAAWQWYDDWQLANQPVAKVPVVAKSDAVGKMIAAIPDKHLFGQAFNGNVPITNLQLKVTGIVKFDGNANAADSKAYISISGQPSKIYQIGDNLPYGVKIYDISENSVILENDGRLEKLPMPRQKLHFKPRITTEG